MRGRPGWREDRPTESTCGRLGAQPIMGSSSGSLTASRSGRFPSGRGRDESFPDFQLSQTVSLEMLEHRRLSRAWTPVGGRSFGSVAATSNRPRVFSSLPSPRPATPHEQRMQAVKHLSRGVGVIYGKTPLWTAHPSNSLAGICI